MNAIRRTQNALRTTLAFAFLCIASPAVGHAQASAKVDITGKWLFTVTTDNGTGTPTVTFKQTGDSLSGHYSSQVFGEVDFKGTIKSGQLKFALNVAVQGQSLVVTYTGTVESADSMKGSLDLGGFGTGTFSGARQKP